MDKKLAQDVIYEKRLDKKETQAAMASKLGIKQSSLANIESGRNSISANVMVEFYKNYGVNLMDYDMTPTIKIEEKSKPRIRR